MSTSNSSSSASDSGHSIVPSKRKRSSKEKVKRPPPQEDSEDDSSSDSDSDANEVEDGGDDDVPVLSHAEQRRQKRKLKKTETTTEQDGDADSAPKVKKVKNSAEVAPSKAPKRQNSVWIGNLSFKTTPDSIRQFFDGVGEITRIHMPMKLASGGAGGRGAVKENRGFAYVDFATPDSKTVAIALSEGHLDGRRLLIKDGGDFTGRPSTSTQPEGEEGADKKPTGMSKTAQKILRSQKQPAGPSLFLGNLGFATTEQSIRDMLESHRAKPVASAEEAEEEGADKKKDKWIRKIRLGTFEDTGKCKGWAFVDFINTEHATAALTNPKNFFLDGRKLVVEYASPDAVRRGGAGPRAPKERKPGEEGEKNEEDGEGGAPQRKRVRPVRKNDAAGDRAEGHEASEETSFKKRKVDGDDSERPARTTRGGREWEGKSKLRAKPGAALANAKRESTSIVPSQGKKITF